MDEILRIEDLRVYYRERDRTVKAVDGVSLSLREGTILALVGESGCGKTTTALATLDLIGAPGRIEGGRVFFEGRDLLRVDAATLRSVRGRQISIIFQEALSGLNPVMTVGDQVAEIVRTHTQSSKPESKRIMLEALARQSLAEPERVAKSYPYQLSGGMCQRVMIAIATVLRPRIIIADEPTSALDVTVQAAILRELDDLKRQLAASIILITHDLGVVAQLADEVAIMYAGRIVEHGATAEVYARPRHPYTAALLAARPRLDQPGRPLHQIRGTPPDLAALAPECAFLPRCNKAVLACRDQPWPALAEIDDGHEAACFNPVFQPEAQRA
jgi:oligopeptide/dipeptide ABC transporter ATP-binding protein